MLLTDESHATAVAKAAVGDVVYSILRGDETITVTAKKAEAATKLGVAVKNIPMPKPKVVVIAVADVGAAAGLVKSGDKICTINGMLLTDESHATAVAKAAVGDVVYSILRGNEPITVTAKKAEAATKLGVTIKNIILTPAQEAGVSNAEVVGRAFMGLGFPAMDGVPHELPAPQADKRAAHGGFTTEEIAGGYAGDCAACGANYGSYVLKVSENDPENALQVQFMHYNFNCCCGLIEDMSTQRTIPFKVTRSSEKPNVFTAPMLGTIGVTAITFLADDDPNNPPTAMTDTFCGCDRIMKRTDWSSGGGPCGDPNWPCAPQGQLMFRDASTPTPAPADVAEGKIKANQVAPAP